VGESYSGERERERWLAIETHCGGQEKI